MALDWHCLGFNFHILFLSTPEPKETITRKKGKQDKDDFLMDITFKSRVKGRWCAVLRLCDVGGGGTLLRANRCGMVRFSLTIVKFIAVAATDAADDDAACFSRRRPAKGAIVSPPTSAPSAAPPAARIGRP